MLDDFEVTVGRFRPFMRAYAPDMIPDGAGNNPNNALDPGWDPNWNDRLSGSVSDFATSLKCKIERQTWTDLPGDNESRPINCIDWYEANAFCIWDGGRLPTNAEWLYAASGGDEQRRYPWSSKADDTELDDAHVVFCGSNCGSTQNVGSRPLGNGRWGQADLLGNVWEWVQDYFESPYGVPCDNCANLTVGNRRVERGGSFLDDERHVTITGRRITDPSYHSYIYGIRCARSP